MTQQRNSGCSPGCLAVLIPAIVALVVWILISIVQSAGSDDCYTTGKTGSAQYQRDLQHCIKDDR